MFADISFAVAVFCCPGTYLGDSVADWREILHDGRAVF